MEMWPCVYRSHQSARGLGATYRPTAIVALAALHTVPGEVSNTTAGVASLASAAEVPVAPTAVSASTTARRIWAVAGDMAGLTAAVTLGIRAAIGTAPRGGAIARLPKRVGVLNQRGGIGRCKKQRTIWPS